MRFQWYREVQENGSLVVNSEVLEIVHPKVSINLNRGEKRVFSVILILPDVFH